MELLTTREAAAYLRLSESRVRSLCRSGEIPALRLNGVGRYRIPRSELLEHLEEVTPRTDPIPEPERQYASSGIIREIERLVI